jgi:hypothetical protein
LLAPEKYVGFYLGNMVVCAFYIACAFRYGWAHRIFNRRSYNYILDGSGLSLSHGGSRYSWTYTNLPEAPKDFVEGRTYIKSVLHTDDPFNLGTLSASVEDKLLFLIICFLLLLSITVWIAFALVDPNPGVITSRDEDFDDIMDRALLHCGPPPAEAYCHITLVKKPVRSVSNR